MVQGPDASWAEAGRPRPSKPKPARSRRRRSLGDDMRHHPGSAPRIDLGSQSVNAEGEVEIGKEIEVESYDSLHAEV